MIISLGSNMRGPWGEPPQILARAIARMRRDLGGGFAISSLYLTAPVGGVKQPAFWNQIVALDETRPPAEVLRYFKRLEREAGRRTGTSRRWGERPLDIDLIDCGGRVFGWRRMPRPGGRGKVVSPITLPHPRAHERAFVLVPLLEVVPEWVHPVLKHSGRQLLARIAPAERRSVLVSAPPPCDSDT